MSTATIEPKAVHWPCTSAEYHADSKNSVSHSELECFARSPRLYEGRYLTGEFPREESAALDLGTVFHESVLLGRKAYTLIPEEVLSGGAKRGKAWTDFEAAHAGEILLKASEAEPLVRMEAAIRRDESANRHLSAKGESEYSVRWTCAETGLQRRARLDRLLPKLIVDLKSTRDASPKAFDRAAVQLGYHRQAAYYQDAIEALGGERLPFVFVAVEKAPPFDVAVFELDSEFIDLGRRENARLLRRFAACRESGVWRRESEGRIILLSAPQWAFSENAWEID